MIHTGRYELTQDLNLSDVFWADMVNIISLLAITQYHQFEEHHGVNPLDPIESFINRVRALITSKGLKGWTPQTIFNVEFVFANALLTLGRKGENADYLQEAAAFYQSVLKTLRRQDNPLLWADVQHNLGEALTLLGKAKPGRILLDQAVKAFNNALKVRTRQAAPFAWISTKSRLGSTLIAIGVREKDTASLKQALKLYEDSLEECTRERVPLLWAELKNGLGIALRNLGNQESVKNRLLRKEAAGKSSLERSVLEYRDALKVRTRKKTPYHWAATWQNLAIAFLTLADHEPYNRKRYKQAYRAARFALKVHTKRYMPHLWARTQVILGQALLEISKKGWGSRKICMAIAAFRHALTVQSSEQDPIEWAGTRSNLAATLA